MRFQLRHFFGLAVSVLFVFCVSYGIGNDAQAQTGPKTISVFPANANQTAVDKVKEGADADSSSDDISCGLTGTGMSPMACNVQELVDLAAPGDTVMFMAAPSGDNPNVYDDVGEILVTKDGDNSATPAPAVETITIRGRPSGDDDMITFTGKVIFNVKASNIVIRGFKFKDTEIPDAVTIRSDDPSTTGDQSIKYGFPGKSIRDYLASELTAWDATDVFSPSNIDSNTGFGASAAERFWFSFVDEPLVTVAGDSDKPIANYRTGEEVNAPSATVRDVTGTTSVASGMSAASALNVMGTVWVDSTTRGTGGQSCPAGGILVRNVQIRNNVFDNTYLTGVKAGDHSYQDRLYLRGNRGTTGSLQIPGGACGAQVEIVGNNFMNVGGNGPFLKESETAFVTDTNGNKIAGLGNREPAISFYNVGSTGTGSSVVSSKITDNTIVGGTSDAILLVSTPNNARVDITHNEIRDSILNGIDIVAYSDGPSRNPVAIPTADIRIENNRIVGSSNNRFLTSQFSGMELFPDGVSAVKNSGGYFRSQPPGDGGAFQSSIIRSCLAAHSGSGLAADIAVVKAVSAEVWKSSVPTFPFPATGAPRSLLNDAGDNYEFSVISGTAYGTSTSMSRADIVRYRADECYDLGRIRVDSQAGVTIKNNDLGYSADASGISFVGSPKNGVVFKRYHLSTNVPSPKVFTGNNIGYYAEFAVLNAGTVFSAKDNYLGVPGSYRAGDNVNEVNNNGGVPFETNDQRMIGPREQFAMPDEEAPELVESGDDAPAVSESGLMLTLTFNDMLDAESVPAATAFTVRSGTSATIDVTGVRISGNSVILTLGSASAGSGVRDGETITVSYAKPASGNVIRDDAGLELESFSNVSVTNNSTATAPGTDDGDDGDDASPGAASTDGGCALASAGSGVDLGALVLLLGSLSFAFGLGRKAKAE